MKRCIETNKLAQDEVVLLKGRVDGRYVAFKVLEGEHFRLATVFLTYSNLRGKEIGVARTFLVSEDEPIKSVIGKWTDHPFYDYKSFSLWTSFQDMKRLDSVISGTKHLDHYFIDDSGVVRYRAFSNNSDSYYDIDFAVSRFPTLDGLHHVVVDDDERLEILN